MAQEPTKDASLYPPLDRPRNERLGMDFAARLPATTITAVIMGTGMGAVHGGTRAAFKFRAENAHRFPTTSIGWYQYHKSKNYKSMIGGAKEGIKMGSKLGSGAMAFCLFEETVDHARGQSDFFSTVTAGLSISGIYSVLAARHDMYTAARTVKLGLKMSLAYGLLQDAVSTLKGNRPRYVEFILNSKNKHTASEHDNVMR